MDSYNPYLGMRVAITGMAVVFNDRKDTSKLTGFKTVKKDRQRVVRCYAGEAIQINFEVDV